MQNLKAVFLTYNAEMESLHSRLGVYFDPVLVVEHTGDTVEAALLKVILNQATLLDAIVDRLDD